MKTQRGFTLLELMIVVSIIGILSAIAIPAYRDYVLRSRILEGIHLASAAKTAVVDHFHTHGVMPTDNIDAQVASPTSIVGNNVSRVTVDNGAVVITYTGQPEIAGKTLVFSPATIAGSVQWSCAGSSSTIANKYKPSPCRN